MSEKGLSYEEKLIRRVSCGGVIGPDGRAALRELDQRVQYLKTHLDLYRSERDHAGSLAYITQDYQLEMQHLGDLAYGGPVKRGELNIRTRLGSRAPVSHPDAHKELRRYQRSEQHKAMEIRGWLNKHVDKDTAA